MAVEKGSSNNCLRKEKNEGKLPLQQLFIALMHGRKSNSLLKKERHIAKEKEDAVQT